MNKKGADKLLSMYWFVIITLVAGGIIAMVMIFYASPYDVREVEANVLSMKVSNCLYPGGKLNNNLFLESGGFDKNFNLEDECGLDFRVKTDTSHDEFYVKVDFYLKNDLENSVYGLDYGNSNWVGDCSLEDGRSLVKCSEVDFFVLDDSENLYLVKITSIVRKVEQNVRQ